MVDVHRLGPGDEAVAALGPTAGDTVDRQHVEALLARADALVHETARDLGTDAPVTAP